jgi:hypothetical protein
MAPNFDGCSEIVNALSLERRGRGGLGLPHEVTFGKRYASD